jgi:hypothetical protein
MILQFMMMIYFSLKSLQLDFSFENNLCDSNIQNVVLGSVVAHYVIWFSIFPTSFIDLLGKSVFL